MKKLYETVWEVFNECANNQMRDVFFNEIELDENGLEDYIRSKIQDPHIKMTRSEENGNIIYDIDASGIQERFSFTEIKDS